MTDTPQIDNYPVLPLKNVVLFPGTIRPLFFNRPQSVEALRMASSNRTPVLVVTLRNPDAKPLTENDFHAVGVIGHVLKLQRLPNGTFQAVFKAERRGHLARIDLSGKYFKGNVEPLSTIDSTDINAPHLLTALRSEFIQFLEEEQKNTNFSGDLTTAMDLGRLADTVAPFVKGSIDAHQEILETLDSRRRAELVYSLLTRDRKLRAYERDLRKRVENQLSQRQKEYFLNEQIKVIQDELGENEEQEHDILAKAIEDANMPAYAKEVAEKELKRLKRMGNNHHEAAPARNYIDWLISIPWNANTEDVLSLKNARAILDEDHYGLEKPKERIIEYIAVSKAVGKLKGPIICLSGPPGVGKTSLAKSIARSLGRKFARISLGGVRDEAEIRGHRRTYVGALPGKIIQTMKKVKTNNPVILLDEIDKISQYHTGGPVAAMLEVLDPEQNSSFMDHYLELEYDLSNVLFICTANDLATIPLPLRDRMEIIELSGYTELEKVSIARRYLIPKQMEENGIEKGQLRINDTELLEVIRGFTREAGVRSLERTISKICRKAVTEKLDKNLKSPIKLTNSRRERYLGPVRFQHQSVEKQDEIGMVTGLAWTSVGGETLSIEVTVMRGTGKIELTGTLGDVMKESAKAAISYVRANANSLGIYSKVFQDLDIHIHVPAGGTPKDGPSAGIALTSGIVSALTKIPIHWDVALTGEVTLRGRVLPIGGLKEKLLAAKRAHIKTVLIPSENEKDLHDVPEEILQDLDVQPVKHVSEVLPIILNQMPIPVDDSNLDDDLVPPISNNNLSNLAH